MESLGFQLHLSTSIQSVEADASGAVNGAILANSERIEAQVIVFATGVRPDDALARSAGLTMGARGGIEVNSQCRTSDDRIFAIGECASIDGRCFGLVAPGYAMAEVVAQHLAGHEAAFVSGDLSTKLKLLGVEVASFGDAFGATPGALDVVYVDQVQGIYKKLVLSDDARTLLGGILVGDASSYPMLRSMASSQQALEADPEQYLMVASKGPIGAMTLSDSANVCACQNVDAGTIRTCIVRDNAFELSVIKTTTLAGTGCGSCLPLVKDILKEQLLAQGKEVSKALCEHFKYSRQELFDLVRVEGIKTFSLLIERHGSARGCDICKPAVASILATAFGAHPLDNEFAAIQDTNDHLLANIQRNGSYSVVPRIPGGEITPEGLIAIGEVAKEFGLYTKITGAQRIDLLGARAEQLPAVWERLVTAGFESGHAYGKSLRTVKSCVGSTWCRYGVQDSVSMAIGLELRYRGLRSPHKLKFGVSGCARECAEARGKDVGVIATERGWNLYVGGNGGFTPRHAQLLVSDIDSETLIRYIDRFLMYYIRTADRLQRTAPWIESLDGGLAHVKEVVVEDSLGLSSELEAAMALHIDNYVDEWKMVLEDPKKLSYFNSFVNDPTKADPSIEFVTERSQPRPIPIDLNRDKRKVSPSTMAKDDASNWVTICHHSELIPERPVAALLDDNQVAVVMLADGTIHAIENLDPFSGANVLARGLVGNKGDRPVIISPMYKQAFDLTNGHCLEDDSVRLAIHPVRVINGRVEVCR